MKISTRRSRVGSGAAANVAFLRLLSLFAAVFAALIGLGAFARPASAYSFVDRSLTLPGTSFELGLGLGLGHRDVAEFTGLGINLEIAYGLTSALELRFRAGLRLAENGRATAADRFGRPVETETYNLGVSSVANPQLGLRFLAARLPVVELGLDAHAILPVSGSFGLLLGVPVALRLGPRLRVDSGLYVPIRFAEPDTIVDISVPLHVWLKVNPSTFLGLLAGVIFNDGGSRSIPLGFGAGYSLTYDAEVRFWLLFPDIRDEGLNNFGFGAGLYVLF
jgi:hypothetical protein